MADALTPEQQRSMVAAHLPTLTKAAGGCYLGKYDLHQLTSVELQRLLDNAAAVSAADNRALTEERDALRERVEALEKALQTLLIERDGHYSTAAAWEAARAAMTRDPKAPTDP